MFLELLAKTFKEDPKASTPRKKISAQFDISSRMVLHKPNQKRFLSYQQDFAYLNDGEETHPAHPPLNGQWGGNLDSGFSAFHLTLKNCLQQTEASSRNDAKDNDLALFVHSKPSRFFLLISFTLSTHTRTTLTLVGRLLGLHVICPHSFTRFFFQDLIQNQELSMCSLQKNNWIALDHCNVLGMQERWSLFDPQIP